MSNINNKLTDSAKCGLENILREYKERLIEEAYMYSAYTRKGEMVISLEDLIAAKERIHNETPTVSLRMNRKKRLFFLMAIAGIAYTIMGLVLFVMQNYTSFNIHTDLGVVCAFISSVFSGFSIFFIIKSNNTEDLNTKLIHMHSNLQKAIVLQLWAQIESLAKHLMSIDKIETKGQSISHVINYLESVLGESIEIQSILRIRNAIAHGMSNHSKQTMEEIIEMENQIIHKLEILLAENYKKTLSK